MALETIEASLTGESVPVTKSIAPLDDSKMSLGDRTNMGFLGTVVAKGHGAGIVVKTGAKTQVGRLSSDLATPSSKGSTLLQRRLKTLGKVLVVLSITLCALMVGVGFLRRYLSTGSVNGEDVKELSKLGVSLAVSVIPEGLVAVVTITMAFGVGQMAKRNAIVRQLPAVETLGAVTVLCADKTGTLTEGIMKASEFWVTEKVFYVTGGGTVPEGEIIFEDSQGSHSMKSIEEIPEALSIALTVGSLCNNAVLQRDPEGHWEPHGDPTEVALLMASYKGFHTKEMGEGKELLFEEPFDSDRRRMTTAFRESNGSLTLLSKGAPSTLLPLCSFYLDENSKSVPLTEEHSKYIRKKSEDMEGRGLRVLALAHRRVEGKSALNFPQEKCETDLTFVGFVGLFDPPREEVLELIQKCEEAGVKVTMLTGDSHLTASSIATQLGIIERHTEIMKGPEIDNIGVKNLSSRSVIPRVFARLSPHHKYKVVKALQMRGEVVAMTGDGVNDAPAIRLADVAIAMGSATDLTKECADIILTDNHFSSIIAALEEGRRIYDNIQKFILYLLSCNSSEIYVMLVAIFAGIPVPFTPVMILWANLIADVPPALALGIDPPASDVLRRHPRDPHKGIFSKHTILIVLFQGLSMSGLTIALYVIALYIEDYKVPSLGEPSRARGLAFVTLVMIQLIHAFLSRSLKESVFRKDIFSNYWLNGGVLLSALLLVGGCYLPGVQQVLAQWPLNWFDWIQVIICVVIHIFLVEIQKFIVRKYSERENHQENDFYEDV